VLEPPPPPPLSQELDQTVGASQLGPWVSCRACDCWLKRDDEGLRNCRAVGVLRRGMHSKGSRLSALRCDFASPIQDQSRDRGLPTGGEASGARPTHMRRARCVKCVAAAAPHDAEVRPIAIKAWSLTLFGEVRREARAPRRRPQPFHRGLRAFDDGRPHRFSG